MAAQQITLFVKRLSGEILQIDCLPTTTIEHLRDLVLQTGIEMEPNTQPFFLNENGGLLSPPYANNQVVLMFVDSMVETAIHFVTHMATITVDESASVGDGRFALYKIMYTQPNHPTTRLFFVHNTSHNQDDSWSVSALSNFDIVNSTKWTMSLVTRVSKWQAFDEFLDDQTDVPCSIFLKEDLKHKWSERDVRFPEMAMITISHDDEKFEEFYYLSKTIDEIFHDIRSTFGIANEARFHLLDSNGELIDCESKLKDGSFVTLVMDN